ncbi:hypothetical protein JHN52_01035 [Streptomyces sp. MBT97]|uniref:hypothetical protein n=1 Tax=Streptomyces sp. MBT97 TaxID=2800411 RepID=UPI00190CDA62|nr:hypothetical protein [Streptomyces sp. MBT97]MBK3631565.1 hypothetical protein [Streptomyces sp. MBT97]
MPLTSSLGISVSSELTQAAGLGTGSVKSNLTGSVSLASGTGAGKADKVYQGRRTLAASASEDLDLAGVLLDAFGSAITFVRVKGLFIKASAGNTNNVVVGAASSNQWATLLNTTGTITLRPGTSLGVVAGAADAIGYAVTASTGDLLKVANSSSGTSVTYDICIIGASA